MSPNKEILMPDCDLCGFPICLCEELGIARKPAIAALPINIDADLMRSLPAYQKSEALRKYHAWLTKVRKQEKQQEYNRLQRIYNATHPEVREKSKLRSRASNLLEKYGKTQQ